MVYPPSVAEAWVYVLCCADGSLYTGWTVDVQRKWARLLSTVGRTADDPRFAGVVES